ncbi:endolytic transglycosylase MltG [Actibacterium sp. 188UL27-1]|uniref:endolytic transglycosylase MltG n=1 Tax=Actibacterium sp. 188UL27-1 TaxID=2786961 RepID=UPI001958DEFA|nr:endolytic transglycosylase MltG [Actibacterium sp. 188UL27-1]MBM7068044.1 endolytic transglycosylase MltG [Actibacterium sp. 188UL27-1]
MWRALASNALTVFVVALIGAAIGIGWAQSTYRGSGPLVEAICLQVEPGSNMTVVSRDLVEKGAVANGAIFRMGADYTDKTGLLKAGSFLVQPGSSMEEIVDTITRGGRNTCGTDVNYRIGVLRTSIVVRELDPATNDYRQLLSFAPGEDEVPAEYEQVLERADARLRVTLAEGATSWQVVDALRKAEFLQGDIAEVPAEGMLAPDSYDVQSGDDRAQILSQMQQKQSRILADLWAARDTNVPLQSAEEALVLASIVEKETAIADERRRVASVFVNRLNQGMRLQTDPTVIYGITKGQGALGRGLRQSELRRETPYNTYVIDGLPPTPIANPGAEAIRAALNPDSTSYLFFVADGTGGHAFAETLAEHNENVSRWREIEAQRQSE